tara:strand:- start:926 stop:1486 length:561 start_codon:yes stop_codon:yes gene_type:complete
MRVENRVAAGIPTGGQFAPHSRADSEIELSDSPAVDRSAALEIAQARTLEAHAASRAVRERFNNATEGSPQYYAELKHLQNAVGEWQDALGEEREIEQEIALRAAAEKQPPRDLDEAREQTANARAAAKSARIAVDNAEDGSELYYMRLRSHMATVDVLNDAIAQEKDMGGSGLPDFDPLGPWSSR